MVAVKDFLLIALASAVAANGEKVSYSGYKVYHVTPNTQSDVDYLRALEGQGVNFWKFCWYPSRPCDVLLSLEQQDEVLGELSSRGIAYDTFIDNVQSLIESQERPESKNPPAGKISWDQYYRVDEIYEFLAQEAVSNSDIVSVQSIGQSAEGRNLNVIKISKSPTRKPVIFVEANAHAREWITSAVATYLVQDLIHSQDPVIQKWTEDFDWYVLPIFNPDGLEYTHVADRMWRKNRANLNGTTCIGIDLNRNFDYNWGGVGASHDPCQITYCGTGANSEPETQAVISFVQTLSSDLVFYLSVHSYSQYIMFPYGDTVDQSFYDNYMKIASDAATALASRYGTTFEPGNWLEILYPSTGDSMDWAQSKLNVSLSLTYEMRDTGRYGFLLPDTQILESSLEFIDSLKPIIDALRNPTAN